MTPAHPQCLNQCSTIRDAHAGRLDERSSGLVGVASGINPKVVRLGRNGGEAVLKSVRDRRNAVTFSRKSVRYEPNSRPEQRESRP